MNRRYRAVTFFIAAIVIIAFLPLLYGWILQPEGAEFTGLRYAVPEDTLLYYSYLEQVKQGSWLFNNLYVIEGSARWLNIFWLFAGLVGSLFSLPHWVTFSILRTLLTIILLLVVYRLVYSFASKKYSLFAFIFVTLASGWGIYCLFLFPKQTILYTPMDAWLPEHMISSVILHSPHLIASVLLLIFSLYFGYKAYIKNSYRYAVISGLAALSLFQFHTYYVPLVYAVLISFWFVDMYVNRGGQIRLDGGVKLLLIIILSFPSVFYQLYLLFTDFASYWRAYHGVLRLPLPHIFFISYGLLLPLAIIRIIHIFRKKLTDPKTIFLLSWFFVQGFLFFIPLFSFQRKLGQIWTVPMAILAWQALEYFYETEKARLSLVKSHMFRYALIFLFIVLFAPTTIYNFIRDYPTYNTTSGDNRRYISVPLKEAFSWLALNTPADSIILSKSQTGIMIPAYTARYVYVGHGETLFMDEEKRPLADMFFSNKVNDEWRSKMLKRYNIDYVWFGKFEREKFNLDKNKTDFLEPVYNNKEVTIYRVVVIPD